MIRMKTKSVAIIFFIFCLLVTLSLTKSFQNVYAPPFGHIGPEVPRIIIPPFEPTPAPSVPCVTCAFPSQIQPPDLTDEQGEGSLLPGNPSISIPTNQSLNNSTK
jgi:hypothetical protein